MDSFSSEAEQRCPATATEVEQYKVRNDVFRAYHDFAGIPRSSQVLMLNLSRDNHLEYLTNGLRQIHHSFSVLDANRPWLCYWILHSIALLGESIDSELEKNVVDFISRCQDPKGGYGGGPGQMPHLATTYAAINSLVTLGGQKALLSIDRGKIYAFLQRMKDPCGAFRMHDDGEIDVRSCYTAISIAYLLNILDDEIVKGLGDYILSCQTYEGGIAGEPSSEAHGGYTFCGLATMILINEDNRLAMDDLIDWVVFRQGMEGGFQGRSNKLVDGCYSFWQGGALALLQRLHLTGGPYMLYDVGDNLAMSKGSDDGSSVEYSSDSHDTCMRAVEFCLEHSVRAQPSGHAQCEPIFNIFVLQQYILLCCQVNNGGFRDKLGKARDYYHTCYCLSGLSVCQYLHSQDESSSPLPSSVLGLYSNLLEPVHLLHNVVLKRYHEASDFFIACSLQLSSQH